MSNMLPCPFCGGEATVDRQLNCDTLSVKHSFDCFIQSTPISRFHWNDPASIPAVPWADWNTRAPSAELAEAVRLLRECEPFTDECSGTLEPLNRRIFAFLAKHKADAGQENGK